MKQVKKLLLGLLILFIFSFFSQNALSATTIGDTTFPADVGKTYTWKVTHPPVMEGTKFTIKIESIEQGVNDSTDVIMVNITMKTYNSMIGWMTLVDNELYLAANSSQNYLVFEESWFLTSWFPGIIPTPINLTLVAEAIDALHVIYGLQTMNYSIVANTIIDCGLNSTEEYTFNDEGFLTSFVHNYEGEIQFRFVLVTGDGGAAVPFGNYFLILMVISVIALVSFERHKIK